MGSECWGWICGKAAQPCRLCRCGGFQLRNCRQLPDARDECCLEGVEGGVKVPQLLLSSRGAALTSLGWYKRRRPQLSHGTPNSAFGLSVVFRIICLPQ